MSGYRCVICGAYCHGRDPHPGEVDDQCFTCWVAAAWSADEQAGA